MYIIVTYLFKDFWVITQLTSIIISHNCGNVNEGIGGNGIAAKFFAEYIWQTIPLTVYSKHIRVPHAPAAAEPGTHACRRKLWPGSYDSRQTCIRLES